MGGKRKGRTRLEEHTRVVERNGAYGKRDRGRGGVEGGCVVENCFQNWRNFPMKCGALDIFRCSAMISVLFKHIIKNDARRFPSRGRPLLL